MRIEISYDESAAAFEAVLAQFGEHDVERGDYTCVHARDEIAGAVLLADVNSCLARARGETEIDFPERFQ